MGSIVYCSRMILCVFVLLCGAFTACSGDEDSSTSAEVNVEMVWIDPGTFMIGSSAEEVN
jgi:formylglycine-generating enzyme required for sulfatase activity